MSVKRKQRILVVPLDWGLGHATRCIPIIRYLLEKGNEVVLAGEPPVSTMLRTHFPGLDTLSLAGYRISYSKTRIGFLPKILLQLPRILKSISAEKRWLENLLKSEHFDLVISDNRYGLYASGTCSVILTHQLRIRSGLGAYPDQLLGSLHYRFLEKFNACWVVDGEEDFSLGGALSHPAKLPRNAFYVGLLSQFTGLETEASHEKKHILILLSGPEPMRGMLEKILLRQASGVKDFRFVVVAGNPSGTGPSDLPENVTYYPYLTGGDLQRVILNAALVVCRSGYSTLMDLCLMEKKALLIPTPGQTEQEYLAHSLESGGICLSRDQASVCLETDLAVAFSYPGFPKLEKRDSGSAIYKVLDQALAELCDGDTGKEKSGG